LFCFHCALLFPMRGVAFILKAGKFLGIIIFRPLYFIN
jgi:hypothetical protein